MPGTTETRTNIKVGMDTSEVRKGKEVIKDAFSPKTMEGFRRQANILERDLAGLVERQSDLAEQLGKVDQGSKAYKKLADELKNTKTQADLVTASLNQLDRVQQRQARQEEARERRQRRSGGAGFVAGMAQGMGVAQYLPSEQNMPHRIAGAALGGGVRRGAGMAAAPFQTPGIGGLSQAVAEIPFVGGFGSAALQSAAASYQSAVAYDRARLQNLHLAGRQETVNLGVDRARQEAAEAEMQRAQDDEVRARSTAKVVGRKGMQARAAAMRARRQQGFFGRMFGDKTPEEHTAEAYEGAAGTTQDAIVKAQQDQKAAAAKLADASRERKTVRGGLGPIEMGTDLGFLPIETQGIIGQFFGARGGTMGPEGQRQAEEAMAAQRMFGVQAGQAGQFARGAMAGGGGTRGQSLAETLQGAFVIGLRGAQIPELLGTLVSLQQRAEKQGIKIDAQEFIKTTMTMNAAGLQGLQGQRVAGELTGAAQGLAQRGAQSPLDVLMLRAAGFRPNQGLEGYAQAMQRLETPDQDLLNNVMQQLTQGAGGGGAGSQLLLKRALGRMGVQVGMGQAGDLIRGFQGGEAPDITALMGQQRQAGGAAAMGRQAEDKVTMYTQTGRAAAKLEAQRIGVGQGMAGAMVGMERNMINAGKVAANFAGNMQSLNKVVADALTLASDFTKGGGEGTLHRIANLLERLLGSKGLVDLVAPG